MGGAIPKEFIPAVEKGVKEAAATGILGYPMVDLEVDLVDGSYHEVDSSERSFFIAGSMGFKEAAKRARPVLLEPIMDLEVVAPEDFVGEVMGELNARRGRITGMESRGSTQIIHGQVPLATMFGYATGLTQRHPGPGHLHHAVRSLRTSLRFPGGGDFRPASSPGMRPLEFRRKS